MEVKVTKKIVVEMTKEEIEYLIKDKILEQTGISLGETEISWTGKTPGVPFAWITTEEPLNK